MSKTEGFVVLDTESKGSIDDKPNIEKEMTASFGNMTRKKLVDISNLPLQARVSTAHEKSHLMPIAAKEYIDQLKKENMALGKILAERNKIIEVTGIELQKLRVNLQKIYQQNQQLAQSNSQMLVDLNSGKDRLKVLQHELGCKNALLTSKKLEMKERLEKKKCEKFDDEVQLTNCEAAEVTKGSSKVGKDGDKCGNTRRRPKSKSLGPRQVQSKDEIENKRSCVRRQSARFRPEQVKSPSDVLKTEDAKVCVCFPGTGDDPPRENGSVFCTCAGLGPRQVQSKDEIEKKRPCVRRQSAKFRSEQVKSPSDQLETENASVCVHFPNTEDGPSLENDSVFCTSAGLGPRQLQSKDEIENKRPCVRRQSARFRPEQVKSTADLVETEDAEVCVRSPRTEDGPSQENGSTFASISIQDEVREGKRPPRHDTGNKRPCVRRQSARLKSEEPRPASDLLDIEDAKIAASVLNDGASLKDILTSTSLFLKNDDNEANPPPGFESSESKRSSLRPSRQASRKVQSYKEIPLNIKMRRSE